MGFTGLARWVNADAESLTRVEQNIRVNHNGVAIGKWHLSLKSYRSTFGLSTHHSTHGGAGPSNSMANSNLNERSIVTVTMNDTVFVLLEDNMAPLRAEAISQGLTDPLTHYRNTFLTVRPPGSLESLLVMLKARWMPVRHAAGTTQNAGLVSMGAGTGLGMGPTGGTGMGGGGGGGPGGGGMAGGKGPSGGGATPNNPLAAAELIVEGKIYAIGADWLLRVGLVRSKELIKGMLLEAEYLPLPVLKLPQGTSDMMVSNLLTSILPNVVGANIFAVAVSDEQWQDVLWDRDTEEKEKEKAREAAATEQEKKLEDEEKEKTAVKVEGADAPIDGMDVDKEPKHTVGVEQPLPLPPPPRVPSPPPENDDDVYVYGVEDVPHIPNRDWVGVDRDRRSAYLVIGALKSENIL